MKTLLKRHRHLNNLVILERYKEKMNSPTRDIYVYDTYKLFETR